MTGHRPDKSTPTLRTPIRYLSGGDVDALLPNLERQRELVERAYRSIRAGSAETPAAPQLSPRPGTFTYPMPAYVEDGDITSLKWVSDYPANRQRHGLPSVSGLIVVNDSDVGLPVAIMDSAAITAARTAAVSAVCVAAFARERWGTVGIIGYGVQARAHVRALSALNPEAEFRVFSRRPVDAGEFAVSAVSSNDAVGGADVVITGMPLGEELNPPIVLSDLEPTALVLPLDDDASLDRDVSTGAEAFYVDALDDYRQRRDGGTFSGWRVPDGTVPNAVLEGREARGGLVVCANQGMGVLDAVFADCVLGAAERAGAGMLLDR